LSGIALPPAVQGAAQAKRVPGACSCSGLVVFNLKQCMHSQSSGSSAAPVLLFWNAGDCLTTVQRSNSSMLQIPQCCRLLPVCRSYACCCMPRLRLRTGLLLATTSVLTSMLWFAAVSIS
jgi:hypothetical protein